MGDSVTPEHPIDCLVTDFEASGGFQEISVLLERGVTMGVELSEELLLVQGRHRAVTACRTGNDVKGVVAVAFEVTVDGIDVNGEVLSGFFRCGALLDQGDDASTKFQPIPSNSRCIHTSIMSNALIRFPNIRKGAGCPSISLKPYFFHALRAKLRPDMSGTQFEIV